MAYVIQGDMGLKLGSMFDVKMIPQPWVLVRDFDLLGLSVQSFKVPLERSVRKVLIPSIDMGFTTGGYGEWPEHSPDTTQRWGPHPLLQLTGRLRRTATALARWQFTREEAFMADWPASVSYGLIHQVGGSRDVAAKGTGGKQTDVTRMVIPARPFLEMQPNDMEKIEMIFMQWLSERIAWAGFKGRGPGMGMEGVAF
jgi:phage gpG-like protein